MKISIVIPAHNEEKSIGKILDQIAEKVPFEIVEEVIVVDDHSTDSTSEVVKDRVKKYPLFNIKVICNDTPPGFANALRKGRQEAKGDLILHLMGDGCDNIEDINLMFEKFKNGHVDMVCGSRYVKGGERKGGSVAKGFFSRFVGVSLHYIIGIPTRDVSNAFKMYRREILGQVKLETNGFEISMELGVKHILRDIILKKFLQSGTSVVRVIISYPPLRTEKGCPTLGQNRQFQYFKEPTYIYPVVPAQAATLLKENGYEVVWNDCIAESWNYEQFLEFVQREKPDLIAFETKTPVVKQHWKIINDLKNLATGNCIIWRSCHCFAGGIFPKLKG